MDSNNTRIENLIKEVRDLKSSLEYTQSQVEKLHEMGCHQRLNEIEAHVEILIEKTDDLENRSRRNNLCFEGITGQSSKETWEQYEKKVMNVIEEKINLPLDEINVERVHWVGSKKPENTRAIVVKFSN